MARSEKDVQVEEVGVKAQAESLITLESLSARIDALVKKNCLMESE